MRPASIPRLFPPLLALASVALACAERDEPPPPRGLFLCVFDTLRADHLSLYGHERATSPYLEELAAESVVFDQMYAQCSWTKPSTASILTGLHPRQHGAIHAESTNRLAPGLVPLAEVFAQAGFVTGAFSENPHIQAHTGFDQGFDRFQGSEGFKGDPEWVLASARGWLAERTDGAPFFLYLHVLDPHSPYEPPRAHRLRFLDGLETGDERVREGRVGPLVEGEALAADWDPADAPYLAALYDAEIRAIDGLLRKLWASVEESGRAQESVLVVTSDHGEEFLEHGSLKHGFRLYEESVRVPLLIRAPGFAPRRPRGAVVSQVDLYPTLLELFDLPLPEALGAGLPGASLVPWMRGETPAERPAFLQTDLRGVRRLAVRDGPWKLVVHADEERVELFNLEEDPAESVNRFEEKPALVQSLLRLHARGTAPLAGLSLEGSSGAADPALEEALRSLGYLGD